MDPIAHTFVGSALAQTGLARKTRFGAAALIIGANLPDIDGLAYFWGGDAGLHFRRGWTHGLPAVLALPLILVGVLHVIGRLRPGGLPPPRPRSLLLLSYLAVATHPLLDWLNTYGMRWLMPFNGRWFYGDSLFIIDPWIWLVLGGAVFLGHSKHRLSLVAWAVLAGLMSLLMLGSVPGLFTAKALWLAGLAALVLWRICKKPLETTDGRLAIAALLTTTVYIGLMLSSARYGRHMVVRELTRQGFDVVDLMVGPVPVNPFVRDVVVSTPSSYRYGSLELLPQMELHLEPREIPRPQESQLHEEALGLPNVRGFMNWVRFPFLDLEETPSGCVVHIMDARYTRARSRGFGAAAVPSPEPCPPF
jgi:inner membrane protein